MSRPLIYFDHNATSPVYPEVLKAMEPFWVDHYGNPSSIHQAGVGAARALKQARQNTASFLGILDESEIIFTSGGTESNNAAFRSALWTQKGRRRIVTTTVEHSSILKLSRALQENGIEVTPIPVSKQGELDRDQLERALGDDVALVSVMMANNETGVIFPVEDIGRRVREKRILFHVDAVQAAGKMPFSVGKLDVDFLSISAHKFGGPKGVGVLYVRKGVPYRSFVFGGGQERGRRAGTENVPGIVGLGATSERLKKNLLADIQKMNKLRDLFEKEVLSSISACEINGQPGNRIPNTSNLAFQGVDTEALLILLDQEGVCASSGSACVSGAPEPSHVLRAMGHSNERARSSVRFSFSPRNTHEEVSQAVNLLKQLVSRLREIDLKEQHPHPSVQ